jgi:hypothetical protein
MFYPCAARAQDSATETVKPPTLTFAFQEVVTVDPSTPIGDTPLGKRAMVRITGGTMSGEGIRGKVLPGGWDWQLTDSGGCFHLKADYMLQTDDGVMINVLNTGNWCKDSSGKTTPQLTTPVFEAPKGRYDWLNGGAWVGTLEVIKVDAKPAVRIRFYRAQ